MARPAAVAPEEKTRIVLSVLAGEVTVAEAARRAKVSNSQNPGVVNGVSMLVRVGIDDRRIWLGLVPDSATG